MFFSTYSCLTRTCILYNATHVDLRLPKPIYVDAAFYRRCSLFKSIIQGMTNFCNLFTDSSVRTLSASSSGTLSRAIHCVGYDGKSRTAKLAKRSPGEGGRLQGQGKESFDRGRSTKEARGLGESESVDGVIERYQSGRRDRCKWRRRSEC